ncbi:uncharacterized protein M6B38_323740 [Iris pallida]|uniref:RING-type E3 ubiquitin transferase n=1 Tax=Iris pallida TaxID=29817 RepID=A0AAX6H9H1_IRIPA|nr:uncharacterized protein M6B38_323740 [Iris pallida]
MDPNTGANPTLPPTVSSPRGYVLSGKLMLSGIVVLFAIAIFLLFLHFYVRWYVARRHDRLRRRRRSLLVSASAAEDESLPHSPASHGLDKGVLDSLSVEVFSDADADAGGGGGAELEAECAVCLNEFGEGEKVRVLPRCGHRFHVCCIDMWFCSHSTCPLCRCAVGAVAQPAPAARGDGAASESAASVPAPGIAEVRIEIPEESGSTSSEAPVKLPGHLYILSIRRFFVGELRVESADRATPPPPPATPQ